MDGTWIDFLDWLQKYAEKIRKPNLKNSLFSAKKTKPRNAAKQSKEKKAKRSLLSKKKEMTSKEDVKAPKISEQEIWDDALVTEATSDEFNSVIIDDPVDSAAEAELIGAGNPFEDNVDFPEVKRSPNRKSKKVFLPKLDLFSGSDDEIEKTPREVLETKGRLVMECLEDFNVQGELQRITPGPVVTMFEVKPAPGVKVSKIANLSNDIAMALSAVSVRIQAPIPGKDSVGIEIPNEVRELVSLKELFAADVFTSSKDPLTLDIG